MQSQDDARPAKRARLNIDLSITNETADEMADDGSWDDVYTSATDGGDKMEIPQPATTTVSEPKQEPELLVTLMETTGNLDHDVQAEAFNDGEEHVDEQHDEAEGESRLISTAGPVQAPSIHPVDTSNQIKPDLTLSDTTADTVDAPESVTEDAEFMQAATAQKDNPQAEWQFDPSDAESSSDTDSTDDSSSDDSDSDSDGGYEMLDPATAAKILMSGDGEDEDGDRKHRGGGDHQPRTANELKTVAVTKPDVVVTEDMKITELGHVERAVENMVLIKGATPGEYQVLESGSVLCNENREIVGVVLETLGRVQEPMYSVQFNSDKDIEEAGMEHGAKVFYVDSHSTFVFTQPLKKFKGTDASNIHDEEVAEDEVEFSDDEAEAEYKRQKKLAKKAARGGGPRSFGAPGHDSGPTYINGSDAPQQNYGTGMSYDDEPADEFYSPLKRPENLSQMMAGGAQPPRSVQVGFDRGRGKGRGDRGRGDRGRGRGDRGRGRGASNPDRHQRGGQDQHRGSSWAGPPNAHRGNAQSFPDRHNSERGNSHQHHTQSQKFTGSHDSTASSSQYAAQNQYQQQAVQQTSQYQAPISQTYQFNGYTFQHGHSPPVVQPQQAYSHQPQPSYYQPQPPTPGGPVPTGAYINPAFYQHAQVQQQTAYGGWNAQQQQQLQQPGAPTLQQQSNLADILRRMGGPQQ